MSLQAFDISRPANPVSSAPALGKGDETGAVFRKVLLNVLPIVTIAYFVAQLDRVNLSFAALTMNRELNFSPSVYGFGAGIFFWGYFLFEIPSNMIMAKVGARRWISRIMITWGIAAAAMAFVNSPTSLYVVRFLLGFAEAGFLPGIMLYFSYWIPSSHRAWAAGVLCLAVPLAPAFAGPISSFLLQIDWFGISGWKWMFILEGIPAVLLAFVVLAKLDDRPGDAKWLSAREAQILKARLAEDSSENHRSVPASFLQIFLAPRVLLLSLVYHLIVLGLYGVVMWFPQIIKGLGLSNTAIGLISPVPFCLAAVASVWFARHSDRRQERRWHLAITAFVAAAGLVASAYTDSPILAIVAFCFAAIGVYSALPIFWALPVVFLSEATAPAGMALINTLGSFGGFTGPWLVGLVREETGSFTLALVFLALSVATGGVLALLVARTSPVAGTARPTPAGRQPAE